MGTKQRSAGHRETCITCNSKAQQRGLCGACYAQAMQRVNDGKNTDEELVAAGLIKARRRSGRPKVSRFEAEAAKRLNSKRRK